MASINLVIDQYMKGHPNTRTISLSKGSNHPTSVIVPYTLASYGPLLDYCSHLVKPEWQQAIAEIFEQERALIQRRQQLMAQYKQELQQTLPPLIEQFRIDHPEYFI